MSSIHLITGENSYAITQILSRWKQEFIQRHGADNLLELPAKDVQMVELLAEVSTAPFLAEKRLVIIDGIPACSEEQYEQLLQSIHSAVVVLLHTPKLDKRLKVHKRLLAESQVQQCEALTPKLLKEWLLNEIQMTGTPLKMPEIDYLLAKVGVNQAYLAMEVQKLSVCTTPITRQTIDTLCIASSEQEMWGLMSCIAKQDLSATMQYIQRLYTQGESVIGIWSIFVWMMTQLQLMVGAIRDGASSNDYMRLYKVGFGPAKQFGSLAAKIAKNPRNLVFTDVLNYEVALKTGGLQTTADQEQEAMAALEMCVERVCTA